jgi:SAM-dependent methyltransferase
LSRIRRVKEAGISTVALCGGEPTINPDFFDIARAVRENGLNLGLMTNGRMFSYKNFSDAFASLDPEFIALTLYSSDMDVHDRIAGVKGSFAQTLAGLRNISGVFNRICVHAPINDLNIDSIDEIPSIARRFCANATVKISVGASSAIGCGGAPAKPLDIAKAAGAVVESIRKMDNSLSRGVSFSLEGFPLCQLEEFHHLCAEPPDEDIVIAWEMENDNFHTMFSLPQEPCLSIECLICSRRAGCHSYFRELRVPFIENTPNSAGYEYSRSFVPDPASTCSLGEAERSKIHPFKEIALLRDGCVEVYSSVGNCDARSLYDAIFIKQQLYLNVSGMSRNLDFRTAFSRLALRKECAECPRRALCSGLFEAVDGNSFAGIEEKELDWLSSIKGSVLDIGCGTPLFPDVIRQKISAGEMSYLGVDKCPGHSPELNVSAVDFEDFSWDGPPFDHIMMLRSYNHFRDPRLVVEKAASLLRSGGMLHICDNCLFAALKKNVVDNPTNIGRPPHQHFRNHDSEDAEALVMKNGCFEVVKHIPVGPQDANQWFLAFKKIIPARAEA